MDLAESALIALLRHRGYFKVKLVSDTPGQHGPREKPEEFIPWTDPRSYQ